MCEDWQTCRKHIRSVTMSLEHSPLRRSLPEWQKPNHHQQDLHRRNLIFTADLHDNFGFSLLHHQNLDPGTLVRSECNKNTPQLPSFIFKLGLLVIADACCYRSGPARCRAPPKSHQPGTAIITNKFPFNLRFPSFAHLEGLLPH